MKISRTTWENFINCPRHLYLEKVKKIPLVRGPVFTLNLAVDTLLKNEFDIYRRKQTPHPIFKKYNLNYIPYNMSEDQLKKWRHNFTGIRAISKKTGAELFGSVDDVWYDLDKKKLVVLDYKATSKKQLDNIEESSIPYHMSWKRQLDFYAYLLILNGFEVSGTAHWLYCNGIKEGDFNSQIKFNITIQNHKVDISYIESHIVNLIKCLNSDKVPGYTNNCEHCIRDQKILNI